MPIDGVPLYIGGNEANHSAELLRMLTYSIFRGQEGFLLATGGVVSPLDVPGAGVLVSPSPLVINSRFTGGDYQSYMQRILQSTQVSTVANTGPTTKYDMVVANIEDPNPSDGQVWPFPGPPGSDARKFGPYWNLRIVPDVPANALTLDDLPSNRTERGWSAIACARLTRPANSNTILAEHIKQLRMVCNPIAGLGVPDELYDDVASLAGTLGNVVSGRIPIPGEYFKRIGCAGTSTLNYTDTAYKIWPAEANQDILIPPWATQADVLIIVAGANQKATSTNDANVYGNTRIKLGSTYSDNNGFDVDEINDVHIAGADTRANRPGNRQHIISSGNVNIPSSDRGKVQKIQLQGQQYSDANTHGALVCDEGSAVIIQVKFKEQ